MTSKSCSAALRSVYAAWFFCLSCLSSQQDSLGHREHALPETKSDHDDGGDGGGEGVVVEEPLPPEGDSGVEDTYGNPQALRHSAPVPSCPTGQMLFEYRCQPKEKVDQIIEVRESKALEDAHQANLPSEKIDATREFIEQQVIQAEKAEDDLDEIIEQLKRKNAEADLEKKMAGIEGPIDRGPSG